MPFTKSKVLSLSHNLMEFQTYKDPTFPVEIYDDHFSDFFDGKLPCHWHESIELDLMLKGSATYHVDGDEIPMTEGDIVMISPGMMHQAEASDPDGTLVIGITFNPKLLVGSEDSLLYRDYFAPLIRNYIFLSTDNADISASIRKLYNSQKDGSLDEYLCFSYLVQLWNEILHCPEMPEQSRIDASGRQQSQEMKSMLKFIQEHFSESIKIEDLCLAASVSRSECFRLFEKYSLFSPKEYLNNYRLTRASEYLLDETNSVAAVASMCGFDSPSYFSLQFKKHYGQTPLNYRSSKLSG